MRISTISINLLLLCVALIFALALSELIVRIFLSSSDAYSHVAQENTNVQLHDDQHLFCTGPRDRMRYHPRTVYREHPNSSYFELRNDKASFHTYNKYGFRGMAQPSSDRKGVIVLGDSFTRGTLADNTETIPSYLTFASVTHDFINLGTSGHGLLQYYEIYKEHSKRIKHSVVLINIYLGNDFEDNIDFSEYKKTAGARENVFEEGRDRQRSWQDIKNLFKKSRLVRLAYTVYIANQSGSIKSLELSQVKKDLFRDGVRHLISEMGERKLVVATIPPRTELDTSLKRSQTMSDINSVKRKFIDQLAEEYEFDVIHLTAENMITERVSVNDIYGWPDHHLTEYGYFSAAREIAEFLQKTANVHFDSRKFVKFIDRSSYDYRNIECP